MKKLYITIANSSKQRSVHVMPSLVKNYITVKFFIRKYQFSEKKFSEMKQKISKERRLYLDRDMFR